MATVAHPDKQSNLEQKYEDVSPLTSDADTDFEDDPILRNARGSTEIIEHDRELLKEEEEREKLLTDESIQEQPRSFLNKGARKGLSGRDKPRGIGRKRPSRKRRRGTTASRHDEEGKLMYEMEEGGPISDASSQASSGSAELDKSNLAHASKNKVNEVFTSYD